jgi:DNA-directed RNA polymerase, beta subunit
VLVKEMKSLCLNVEVLNSEGQEIDLREPDEDTRSNLGIDLSRRPGADNALAD